MVLYTEGYILEDDEYLLKIREKGVNETYCAGFLTKHNMNGTVPQKFKDWGVCILQYNPYILSEKPPIQIHKEEFNSGWKIHTCRFGESRNWAVLLHPKGFTIEIHMVEFIKLLQSIAVIDGVLHGKFKWTKTKLIQEPTIFNVDSFDTEEKIFNQLNDSEATKSIFN